MEKTSSKVEKVKNFLLVDPSSNVSLSKKGKSEIGEGRKVECLLLKPIGFRSVEKKISYEVNVFAVVVYCAANKNTGSLTKDIEELESTSFIKSCLSEHSCFIYNIFVKIVGQVVNGTHAIIDPVVEAKGKDKALLFQAGRDFLGLALFDLFLKTFDLKAGIGGEEEGKMFLKKPARDLIVGIYRRMDKLIENIGKKEQSDNHEIKARLLLLSHISYKSVVERLLKMGLLRMNEKK